jgi:type IV secretory pathway VirB2 component (pilin)
MILLMAINQEQLPNNTTTKPLNQNRMITVIIIIIIGILILFGGLSGKL